MTTTRAAIRAAIRVALGYGSASCWAMMAATGAMAQDGAGQSAAANSEPAAAAAQNKTPTPDAQNGDSLAEVVVSGIRSSITTARAIKRDSLGIVDAIAPEDIGKLPDTNLAESLQRITGVSI
ncbi:MAG: TonB-dependent receptor, partial [Gammaproteobacteria bacterium]|nr:TonB-dependent receptor [Gammaproteobacteria bacterium]